MLLTPLTPEQKRHLAQLARAAAEALRDAGGAISEQAAAAAWAQVEAELAAREGARRYWRTVFFRALED